jgi:hypothetical protein
MDLLGSILGSMDSHKPPPPSAKEKALKKKQMEMTKKIEEKEKEKILKFRAKIEEQINSFIKDDNKKSFTFPSMDKYCRSIVHDVAEIAGLATYSFGEEEVDRHIRIWKKEFAPCERELAAIRRGEIWDPIAARKKAAEEEWNQKLEIERARTANKIQPKSNYHQKYEHLIGSESALEGARKTETNKQYGMVSSESKKDRRTVEQIQEEMKARKRQKVEHIVDDTNELS